MRVGGVVWWHEGGGERRRMQCFVLFVCLLSLFGCCCFVFAFVVFVGLLVRMDRQGTLTEGWMIVEVKE
jgi:hypothetical protein